MILFTFFFSWQDLVFFLFSWPKAWFLTFSVLHTCSIVHSAALLMDERERGRKRELKREREREREGGREGKENEVWSGEGEGLVECYIMQELMNPSGSKISPHTKLIFEKLNNF